MNVASPDIDYLDHSVLLTKDLEGTSTVYEAMGFTLSPASRHLATATPDGVKQPLGTANRCAPFGETFIEVLAIVDEHSPDPWRVREMAEPYEGLRGFVLGCGDATVAAERLGRAGLASSGVLELERPVETSSGTKEVRARNVHVKRVDGLHIGVAEHLTPEVIHDKNYLVHPNTATGLAGLLLVVGDDELDDYEERYSSLLGSSPISTGNGIRFELRIGRIEIVPEPAFKTILGGEEIPALPYLAAQMVRVADITAARKLVEGNGLSTTTLDSGFFVSAADAAGASVVFEEA